MIDVKFFYNLGFCSGFSISDHANFCEYGFDIVCAGVSSAVQMCVNGLTEIVKADVEVCLKKSKILLKTKSKDDSVQFFLQALELQLKNLAKDYKENIKLSILEEG